MKWFIATNSMQNSLFNIQHTFYLKGSDNVSQRLFLSHIKYIEGQRLLPATSTLNTDKRKSHIMLMYKGHNIEKLYSNEFVHGKGEYKSDPACSRSYSNDCLFLVFINISRHGSASLLILMSKNFTPHPHFKVKTGAQWKGRSSLRLIKNLAVQ